MERVKVGLEKMMSTTVEAIRVQEVIACARSFVRATTKERAARKKTEENDDDNDDVEDTALAATFSHASKNGDDGTVETEVFLRALYTAVDESMQRLVESETRVQRARKSAEDATTTTGSTTIASMETPPPRDGKRGEMVDGARMGASDAGSAHRRLRAVSELELVADDGDTSDGGEDVRRNEFEE